MATPESEGPYVPEGLRVKKNKIKCRGDGIQDDGSDCDGCEECSGIGAEDEEGEEE